MEYITSNRKQRVNTNLPFSWFFFVSLTIKQIWSKAGDFFRVNKKAFRTWKMLAYIQKSFFPSSSLLETLSTQQRSNSEVNSKNSKNLKLSLKIVRCSDYLWLPKKVLKFSHSQPQKMFLNIQRRSSFLNAVKLQM